MEVAALIVAHIKIFAHLQRRQFH